jgi:hypothetical protein
VTYKKKNGKKMKRMQDIVKSNTDTHEQAHNK